MTLEPYMSIYFTHPYIYNNMKALCKCVSGLRIGSCKSLAGLSLQAGFIETSCFMLGATRMVACAEHDVRMQRPCMDAQKGRCLRSAGWGFALPPAERKCAATPTPWMA